MASGGQAPSGFGRGGRGAALLKALQNPPRRPGESSSSSQTSSQAPTPSRTPGSSFGRGASLQRALGTQSSVSSSQASHPGASAPRTPVPLPMGRGILGRGLQMPIEEPQARKEQAAQQQQPTPPSFGRGIPRRAQQVESDTESAASSQTGSQARPTSSPFGRGITRRPQQAESPSSVSTAEREGSSGSQQVQTSGPFGRGIARRAPQSQASAGRTPPDTEMEASAASSQTGRRVTTLEERLRRMDVSDELVEERGTYGEEIPLSANYIPVRCRYDGTYQYAVSFSPQIDSLGMRKKIIHNHEDTIGTVHAFDGSILYVPKQLRGAEITLKDRRPTDGQQITVHIKLVKALHPESCVHIYNIILRKIMRILKYSQIGRQYYDPHRPAQIPQHKMEVWPGYVQTIKRYAGGLMLQIDVSHRVLRTDTVLDVMHDIQRTNPNGAIEEITRKVVGTTVLTRYNNKTYRIDDIEWKMTPKHTFQKGREEVSFKTYYQNMYNKHIRDDTQPLLVHRPKQKAPPGGRKPLEQIILVPELCFCTGLTDEIRSDFRVMKDLATHTRITPEQRQVGFRNFCENVRKCPEACAELDKWGLKIDSETINTRGRYLGKETIFMGQNRSQDAGDRADFTRFVTSSEVIKAIDLRNWLVVTTKRDQTRAKQFVDEMKRVCQLIGIAITFPRISVLENDRTETYLKCLRHDINREVQIVVMIMPTSRDDRYNAVKKLTCVEMPVPSQVINSKTISRPDKLRSIVTKIALQMNCKLGGELWAVKIPGKLLMCIGIDVYHDGKSRKGQSIGAFIASMNGSCTRWYSRVAFQQPGQELIDCLKVCFTAALRKFHEMNGTHPERIIVFRDGVGDGDLPYVADYEAKQLAECFQHFGSSYRPKFAIIVVQKRINTKLFAVLNSRRGYQYQNPPPGTMMDHTITRRNWLDFFLVSQHVGQGTVNPTHYVVVHDDSGWDIDKLQRLAYKMTHLYYNWTGTIRVPAPCQYAHKLAYLVGQNIKKDPDIHLTDRLFFL